MPAALRKADETKTMLFPALIQMMTEVEEDMDTWAASQEEKVVGQTDPFNTAVNAINTLSNCLQEKTVLAGTTTLIQKCLTSGNWKERQAGYMTMGLIAESCKESMKKNMEEAMKMACSGIVDQHPRVRYAGLSCTALLLTELAPLAQKKFHAELMPVLVKLMNTEAILKLRCHAVSCVINFVRGFVSEEDEEEEEKKAMKILEIYTKDLFVSLAGLLKLAITENYEPLQEEVMNLLGLMASLIGKDFAQYYNDFMPMMYEILNNVGQATLAQKTLRSRTIEAMGFMIEAVAEEKTAFNENVLKITAQMVTLLNSGLTNDDPQTLSIKETLAKISTFLKEDFH